MSQYRPDPRDLSRALEENTFLLQFTGCAPTAPRAVSLRRERPRHAEDGGRENGRKKAAPALAARRRQGRVRRTDADACTRSAQAPGPSREGGRRLLHSRRAKAGPETKPRGCNRGRGGRAFSRLLAPGRRRCRSTSRPSQPTTPPEHVTSKSSSALLSPKLGEQAVG